MISTLTCAVSPAQNSPWGLAQIVRRTGTVRRVKVRNVNVTHTKGINQEIILDLVYVPRPRSVYGGKVDPHGVIQEVHLPTGQAHFTEFFRYVMSPRSGIRTLGVRAAGGEITGLLHRNPAVAVSVSCTP